MSTDVLSAASGQTAALPAILREVYPRGRSLAESAFLKAKLARMLARKPAGIVLNEHTDEDGATVFRQACKLGLEGIVSKRLDALSDEGPWPSPASPTPSSR
jgi:hypothetical protein